MYKNSTRQAGRSPIGIMNTSTGDQQRIHPINVEAPLVPRNTPRSDKLPPPFQTAPPYRPPPPPPPKRRNSNCCIKFICYTLLALVLLIVAVAATVGILYLVFRPKLPQYSVDRLRITDFTVDPTLTVRAGFEVTVTAKNPNRRIGIYYEEDSKLSVWYSDNRLCTGRLPEFYQGHKNTTVLNVKLSGQTQLAGTMMAVLRQQQTTGRVPLQFRGDVPVRVKFGGWRMWKVVFKVRCGLVVSSLNVGNQISIRTSSCKFGLKL